MRASDALVEISNEYVSGVAKFYEQAKPNPWQDAHDALEKHMASGTGDYFERVGIAAEIFRDKCVAMIKKYKALHAVPTEKLTAVDAFHIGDAERVNDIQSQQENACRSCGTKKNVRGVRNPETGKAGIFCTTCVRMK